MLFGKQCKFLRKPFTRISNSYTRMLQKLLQKLFFSMVLAISSTHLLVLLSAVFASNSL